MRAIIIGAGRGQRLMPTTADIALVVDTHWLDRYVARSDHPSHDAEKVTVRNGAVTGVHRDIPESDAHGEYIGVIAELAHGFELGRNPADGRPWTIVVDKLAPKNLGFIADEICFLREITTRRIKATLPAPALLGERMWDPERSVAAYSTREAFVRDCASILRQAVEHLRDAGADIVQIDDPHLCPFVDPEVRGRYADAAADFAVDAAELLRERFA